MTDSEDEDSNYKVMFASVRFFCEESNKIQYVSTKDIEDFVLDDYSNPKRVKHGVDSNGEMIFEPAQILAVAGEYYE